jgi:hydrogenase-4 component E
VSQPAVSALVILGFGVLLARRRSLAILLLAAQALLLGGVAIGLAGESRADLVAAALILVVRGVTLPALLMAARRRTPEPGPVVPTTTVVVRLLAATALSFAAVAATPPLGLGQPAAEHGAVALLALGLAIVIMRRPALLQLLGILVAENGVYMLAIAAPGGVPFAIELGVLFDLVLIVAVAVAFSQKIYGEVGSGDTDLLRGLRD